jgi:hypothetical protein
MIVRSLLCQISPLPDFAFARFVYMTRVETFLICLNVMHHWPGFYLLDLKPSCPSTPRNASLWMRGTDGMFKILGRRTTERAEQAAAPMALRARRLENP